MYLVYIDFVLKSSTPLYCDHVECCSKRRLKYRPSYMPSPINAHTIVSLSPLYKIVNYWELVISSLFKWNHPHVRGRFCSVIFFHLIVRDLCVLINIYIYTVHVLHSFSRFYIFSVFKRFMYWYMRTVMCSASWVLSLSIPCLGLSV